MLKPSLLATFVVFTLLFAVTAQAATRYVSDELTVNMRRGPGNKYRITHLAKAGEKVDAMQAANGWTKIRNAKGEEGYVLTRFLSDTPAAREQVAAMREQVATLEQENAAQKKELAQALDGSSELGKLKKDLVAENNDLTQQLERIKNASANAVRISGENQKFRQKILSMQSELERLRHENKSLQSRREGMKIGALVLVVGILIGLVLPLFRRRRSGNNWDSL